MLWDVQFFNIGVKSTGIHFNNLDDLKKNTLLKLSMHIVSRNEKSWQVWKPLISVPLAFFWMDSLQFISDILSSVILQQWKDKEMG